VKYVLIFVVLISATPLTLAQKPSPSCGKSKSPREIVEQLWMAATRGDLLNQNGIANADQRLLGKTSPSHKNRVVFVVSNNWGIDSEKIDGLKAEVVMGFIDEGEIDDTLRYKPPVPTNAVKTGILHRLNCAPTHYSQFRTEGGKLVVDKILTGAAAWQLVDPPNQPFATVNAAIRYVLEQRNKTHNLQIRKNANQTLSQLLRLH
jgi:hypothetical protein